MGASPGARAGTARFPSLFRPLKVRNITFDSRLFFAPMGIDMANHDGSFSEGLREFYAGIADGGCRFLVLSNATVSRDSILQPRGLRMYEEKHAASVASFIAECRAKDVLVGVQLQHYGGQAITTYVRGQALLTPSAVPTNSFRKVDPRYRVRAMTTDDIATVKRQFVDAARLCVSAGARLIQLQASNGYLLSSFLSPNTNRRDDGYGGGPRERARMLIELVGELRAAVGADTILSVRLGVDDCIGPEGSVAEDFETVIPLLEAAGVDLLEVSICTSDTFKKLNDNSQGMDLYLREQVRKIRSYSQVPVGFAGFVDSLATAEALVADGSADMVGMARAIFADNELINKTLQGREHEIHRCLWDGKCFKDKANPKYSRVYCCVNPKYLRPE